MSYRQVIVGHSYLRDLAGIENGLLPLDDARFPLGRTDHQVDELIAQCERTEVEICSGGLGLKPGSLSLAAQKVVVELCIVRALSGALLETLLAWRAAEQALAVLNQENGCTDARGLRDVIDRCEWNRIKLMEFGWIGFKRLTPALAIGQLLGVEGLALFGSLMEIGSDHARALARFAAEHPDCPWAVRAPTDYLFRMDSPEDD